MNARRPTGMVTIEPPWQSIFEPDVIGALERRLPAFFIAARWFGRKTRTILAARVLDRVPFESETGMMVMTLVEVEYEGETPDVYLLPVAAAFDDIARELEQVHPEAAIMPLTVNGANGPQQGLLFDALWAEAGPLALVTAMRERRTVQGLKGSVQASSTEAMDTWVVDRHMDRPSILKGEQSNTSVRFGHRAMLKLYRRLEQGVNPDLELGLALTRQGYRHTPAVLGALEYVGISDAPMTLAIAHAYVGNRGDAWSYTLEQLERRWELLRDFLEHSTAGGALSADPLGSFRMDILTLGRRTAELHCALSQSSGDSALAPEPADRGYWQSLQQRIQLAIEEAWELLRRSRARLAPDDLGPADRLLQHQPTIRQKLHAISDDSREAMRIRCHGDFHLGQVLFTGNDFMIIDFEGEPARALTARRTKQSPMLDVAGMIRSFHYAAHAAFRRHREDCQSDQQREMWEQWIGRWYTQAEEAFLTGYAQASSRHSLWPQSETERRSLLELFLLDKALYELSYELNNRPDWAGIPIRGILEVMGAHRSPMEAVGQIGSSSSHVDSHKPRSS